MLKIKQLLSILVLSLLSTYSVGIELHVPQDYTTIQAALDVAELGDEVVLAEGTYQLEDNESIQVNSGGYTFRSIDPFDPSVVENTVIRGTHTAPVIEITTEFTTGTVLIQGLTIADGLNESGEGEYLEIILKSLLILLILCQLTGAVSSKIFRDSEAGRFQILTEMLRIHILKKMQPYPTQVINLDSQ